MGTPHAQITGKCCLPQLISSQFTHKSVPVYIVGKCFFEWWPNSLDLTAFLSLRACIGRHNSRLGHGWKNLWSFQFKRHTSTFNSAWKVTQTGLNVWFNFSFLLLMMVCNKNFAEKKKDTDSPSQIWCLDHNTRRQLNPAKHQHDFPGQWGFL